MKSLIDLYAEASPKKRQCKLQLERRKCFIMIYGRDKSQLITFAERFRCFFYVSSEFSVLIRRAAAREAYHRPGAGRRGEAALMSG